MYSEGTQTEKHKLKQIKFVFTTGMATAMNKSEVCASCLLLETSKDHCKSLVQIKSSLNTSLERVGLLETTDYLNPVATIKNKSKQNATPKANVGIKKSPLLRECCSNIAFIACTNQTNKQNGLSNAMFQWHELEIHDNLKFSSFRRSSKIENLDHRGHKRLVELDVISSSVENEHKKDYVPCFDMILFYPTKIETAFVTFLKKQNKKVCHKAHKTIAKMIRSI